MKLNTLLLTSAATLMATSVAFAADLPSKKAAPAAGSVQVCKVGGMTGMTLASGVCLGIDGRVTADVGNLYDNVDGLFGDDSGTLASDNSGAAHGVDGGVGFRLNFDARSNTEYGMVRGYVSLNSGTDQDHEDRDGSPNLEITEAGKTTFRKAFIQIGGFTTGLKDSIADIAGTQGNIFTSGWSQSGVGMDYQVNVGGANLGIGIEDSQKVDIYTSDRPDLILHLSGKAGGLGYALAAVSHDANGDNGYAFLGSVNMNLSNVTLFAFAGMSEQANAYTGGSGDWLAGPADLTPNAGDEATSFGGGLTFALSSATSLTVQGVNFQDDNDDVTSMGVYLSHALAKGLTIQPEVVYTDNGATELTSYYLRIQRDF